MATDAVDFALGDRAQDLPLDHRADPARGRCRARGVGRRATVVARTYGWSGQMVDHLLHRYGSLLGDLVDAIAARPDLAHPLEHAPAYLRAEIVYAATHEGVLHLEDVMLHRTRLNYEMRDRGLAALPEIAALPVRSSAGTSSASPRRSSGYTERALAEEAAELEPDDSATEQDACHARRHPPAGPPPARPGAQPRSTVPSSLRSHVVPVARATHCRHRRRSPRACSSRCSRRTTRAGRPPQ